MPLAQHQNGDGIVERAQTLRASASMIERLLWRALRSDPRQKVLKFRFQHPLSRYVADFVCLPAKLVVEIDGASHDATVRDDIKRQDYIASLGFQVLRFTNQDVLHDVDSVVDQIRCVAQDRWNKLREQTPPRNCKAISTLPQGEGERPARNLNGVIE